MDSRIAVVFSEDKVFYWGIVMTYKVFSKSMAHHIKSVVQHLGSKASSPLFAAFDADGTLWDMDISEVFFKYQIQELSIDIPHFLIEQYEYLRVHQTEKALIELSYLNVGHKLSQVRCWATACYEKHKDHIPIFPAQKALIEHLQEQGVRVYIVTGSCKWAVEPFAKVFNIDPDHVIGTEMQVKDNIVTERLKRLAYYEGKVEGLLDATKGIKPFLVAGNTLPDQPLLHLATHIKLAIQSTKASSQSSLYKSEQKLKAIALQQGRENGWFHHQF